jgi:predicted DNA-binding protein (MmcQ/YjbR family)
MPSYIDWVRSFCLSLPHASEKIQWTHNLLFCVGGRMFCIANLEPGLSPTRIALKCTPEKFAELIEIEGIIPAPYMARNHWVAFVEMDALRQAEIKELIESSYHLVYEKLPGKLRQQLAGAPRAHKSQAKKKAKKATAK